MFQSRALGAKGSVRSFVRLFVLDRHALFEQGEKERNGDFRLAALAAFVMNVIFSCRTFSSQRRARPCRRHPGGRGAFRSPTSFSVDFRGPLSKSLTFEHSEIHAGGGIFHFCGCVSEDRVGGT